MHLDRSARIAVASRSFSAHPELRAELSRLFSDVRYNETGRSLAGDELKEFLRERDAAIVAMERIDAELLQHLPELCVVSKFGVGVDQIDVEALRCRHVQLGWTPGVNRRSVAELALCFALCLLRDVAPSAARVRAGGWGASPGRTLTGRTFGIVGLGHIGKELVRLLAPFGCTIYAHDIVSAPEFCVEHGVREVGLGELLDCSELVSLHVPLTSETRGLIDARALARMRPGAYLINTSRGAVVDEKALLEALREGRLAGAASDVLLVEPPEALDLVAHPRFLVTPHVGGSTHEAILEMGRAAIEQLRSARW